MGAFGLYTKFVALSGQREHLVTQLLQAAELLEDAAGCQLYIVNTSPDDAGAVWVTELWDNADRHGAALSLEGIPSLIQETLPLLTGPPEQIRLVPVGGKGLEP